MLRMGLLIKVIEFKKAVAELALLETYAEVRTGGQGLEP